MYHCFNIVFNILVVENSITTFEFIAGTYFEKRVTCKELCIEVSVTKPFNVLVRILTNHASHDLVQSEAQECRLFKWLYLVFSAGEVGISFYLLTDTFSCKVSTVLAIFGVLFVMGKQKKVRSKLLYTSKQIQSEPKSINSFCSVWLYKSTIRARRQLNSEYIELRTNCSVKMKSYLLTLATMHSEYLWHDFGKG